MVLLVFADRRAQEPYSKILVLKGKLVSEVLGLRFLMIFCQFGCCYWFLLIELHMLSIAISWWCKI